MLSTHSGGEPSRRRIAQNACDKCRQRKVKCDGKSPACSSCVSANVECVYEADADRRRKGALRQDIEALTRHNLSLTDENRRLSIIIDGIRHGSDKEAEDITFLLRSKESNDTVANDLETRCLHDHATVLRASVAASLPGLVPPTFTTLSYDPSATTAATAISGTYSMHGVWPPPYMSDSDTPRDPEGHILLPDTSQPNWPSDHMPWYGQGQ